MTLQNQTRQEVMSGGIGEDHQGTGGLGMEDDPFLSLSNMDEDGLMGVAGEAEASARPGDLLETVQKPKQQDIYEEGFKTQLKEFCHNYQIPFLETNLPKSCRNAAKIYYRLLEDNQTLESRFDLVVAHLRSIP
jgi:hypothetical protein